MLKYNWHFFLTLCKVFLANFFFNSPGEKETRPSNLEPPEVRIWHLFRCPPKWRSCTVGHRPSSWVNPSWRQHLRKFRSANWPFFLQYYSRGKGGVFLYIFTLTYLILARWSFKTQEGWRRRISRPRGTPSRISSLYLSEVHQLRLVGSLSF